MPNPWRRYVRSLGLLALPALLLAAGPLPPPVAAGTAPAPVMDVANASGAAKAVKPAFSDSSARDSVAVVRPKSRSDSVIVVQHGFDHREQIITGSVIMSCLVIMLVAMNNYNPR